MWTDVDTVAALMVILGGILVGLDFVHPGIFLIMPGTILLVGGFVLLVFGTFNILDSAGAPFLVVGAIMIAAAVAIPVYQRLAPTHPPLASTVDTLENWKATVMVAVNPGTMKGKIRVRGEVWSATSDEPIAAGSEVRVVGGSGVVLKVVPWKEDPAKPAVGSA